MHSDVQCTTRTAIIGGAAIPYIQLIPSTRTEKKLLFLPGYGADITNYRSLLDEIASTGYEIYLFGIFDNAYTVAPFTTIDGFSEYLDIFCTSIIGRIPDGVIGHSMGGSFALAFGQRYNLPAIALNPAIPVKGPSVALAWKFFLASLDDLSGIFRGCREATYFFFRASLPYAIRVLLHPFRSLRMMFMIPPLTYGRSQAKNVLVMYGMRDTAFQLLDQKDILHSSWKVEVLEHYSHNWPLWCRKGRDNKTIITFLTKHVRKPNTGNEPSLQKTRVSVHMLKKL